MRKYLLDSNTLTHFVNKTRGVDQRAEKERRAGARIGTCVPVIAEMHHGFELSSSRDLNRQRLFVSLRRLAIWPFDLAAAEEYGRLQAVLRRIGRPMQQIDVQIAAIAFSLGDCTVVTTDSDLTAVPGLSVENWTV